MSENNGSKDMKGATDKKKISGACARVIDKYTEWIVFAFLLVISVVIRIKYAPVVNNNNGLTDYNNFLGPWVEHYRTYGIVSGLKLGVGNYYIPYNVVLALISKLPIEPYYGIMAFSAVFDYIISIFTYKIVKLIVSSSSVKSVIKDKEIKVFAMGLTLLPIMVANSGIWKQCDSVYTGLILVSVFFLLKRNYRLAFIMVGIGFTFKMQTIFILPFYVLVYLIRKDFSLLKFLWIPIIYLLGGLPAILCGRDILSTYTIYLHQTELHRQMCVNFPGIYHLGMENYNLFFWMAFVLLFVVFAFAYLRIRKYAEKMSQVDWLYLAGWSLFTCVEFLPAMHERYDYSAILFLTVLMLFFKRKLLIPVLAMHVISACTYSNCLYGAVPNMKLLAVVYFIVYCYVTYDLFKSLESEGEKKIEKQSPCENQY
ncbi:MAG: hypothetical protein IKI20_04550 [Lachnospiraceae bacterium]|nr:hypothetical protein [Lachnospiraceae bacterium]